MQNNFVWIAASLKICQIGKLFEDQKLELKNSRPTPDIAITQDCSSSGIKFLFLFLLYFRFSSFVKIYFYSFIL